MKIVKTVGFLLLFFCIFCTSYAEIVIKSSDNLPKLHALISSGARVSAFVWDPYEHKVIADLNSGLRLSPASVSKLVIGAKALETWGTDKTFSTSFYRRGSLKAGVLDGDLIFNGSGDPYFTTEKLLEFVSNLSRLGLKKVTGKVVVNTSFFGNVVPDASRVVSQLHSHSAYNAGLSSASFNFGTVGLEVTPGKNKGELASVAVIPFPVSSIKIINKVVTSRETKTSLYAERITKDNVDTFVITGQIGIKSVSRYMYKSVSNPERYTAQSLGAFLNVFGIKTSGEFSIESSPLKNTDIALTSVQSFPLAWQLGGLFKYSNNFIADMLTLDLQAYSTPASVRKNLSLQDSSQILQKYMCSLVKNCNQQGNGESIVLNSGSGLTPENRLSARDVVNLLDHIYKRSDLFPDFMSALATPGSAGALSDRYLDIGSNKKNIVLRAKTGTLTEPYDVVSLAGYARTPKGKWLEFAVLVNGSARNPAFGIDNLREKLDADLTHLFGSAE